MMKLRLCYRRSPFYYFQLRVYYYTLMRTVEDDAEAQKRGVVGCVYALGSVLNFDLQVVQKCGKLRTALPARFDSLHACYNDPRILPFVSLAVFLMEKHSRVRFRAHYGSDQECRYQLSSFGFPISAFPVSSRGEFNLENQQAFITTQRMIEPTKSKGKAPLCMIAQKAKKRPKEEARSRQPIIKEGVIVAATQRNLDEATENRGLMGIINSRFLQLPSFVNPWGSVLEAPNHFPSPVPPQPIQLTVTPQSHNITGPTMNASRPPAKFWGSPVKPYVVHDPLPNDILLGRGKPIQQRPGNIRFRDMLDKHLDKYQQGEVGAKGKVSAYIVDIVKKEGGRFLKELEVGGWVEIDDAAARTKVSHAFRSRRVAVFQATLKKDKSTA